MDQFLSALKGDLEKAISYLNTQFGQLHIGRANPSLVEHIKVDCYGTETELRGLANISVPEATSLVIQPWDKSSLGPIEKAIRDSDLNVNPINDGTFVRINLPPLTQDRRQELTKLVHKMAEETKITVRQEREKRHKDIREKEKNGDITEDDMRLWEKKVQELVDDCNHKVDDMRKRKDADIMRV